MRLTGRGSDEADPQHQSWHGALADFNQTGCSTARERRDLRDVHHSPQDTLSGAKLLPVVSFSPDLVQSRPRIEIRV